METTQVSASSVGPSVNQPASDMKRPDKVHPYRLNFWADVMSEDNTSEIMNVLGMMLSMVGILLKYKSCAWLGVLVAAVSFANVRTSHDGKQIMSTFMLSLSSVVMCYLTNSQPISAYLSQQAPSSMPTSSPTPPSSVSPVV